jgi:hypothetical protein
MIEADQHLPSPESDVQLVWVLAEDWDRWRETQLVIDLDSEITEPATPPM